jgi:hypothetical protein
MAVQRAAAGICVSHEGLRAGSVYRARDRAVRM